jgi:hypothetical protein
MLKFKVFDGDWGLGIGDWGFGDWGLSTITNPQYTIPNPQSPVRNMPKK